MWGIKSYLIGLLFLCLASTGFSQNRYAVYYKFKPQSGFTLGSPQNYLSAKALERRSREGVLPDSLDLPIAAKYLDLVSKNSSYILYNTKWLNASVVIADQAQVAALSAFPFVEKVELVAPGFSPPPNGRLKSFLRVSTSLTINCDSQKLNTRELNLTDNSYDFQNELIGIDQMHEEGFTGNGITIAIFDAGFPGVNTASPFSHLISGNKIIAQKDIVRPWNPGVFVENQHGTNVLSLIAANEEGKLVSGAYNSDFILVITEDVSTEYRIEELNWVRGAEYADSLGVDIISSSLGYWDFDDPAMNYSLADLDGETATITKGANIASKKGILVVNSVGNYGSRGASSLVAPADSRNVLAIGSVNTAGAVSGFSSRGPTGDGRLKPDLAAFGESPILVRSNGVIGSSNGTSFSAPQITALAAGLWEAKPEWTRLELIENLVRSATQFSNPDNLLGFGVPNFYDAYYGEILGNESEEAQNWKVYPNPLDKEELKIQFGSALESTFQLIDMSGKPLIQNTLTRESAKSPFVIRLDGLKPGIYLIQMSDGVQIKQTKLLKR